MPAPPLSTQFRNTAILGALSGVSVAGLASLYRYIHDRTTYSNLRKSIISRNPQNVNMHIVNPKHKEEEEEEATNEIKAAGWGDRVSTSALKTLKYVGNLTGTAVKGVAKGVADLAEIKRSPYVLNPTNKFFLPALGVGLSSGVLAAALATRLLKDNKTLAEKQLEKTKEEFRQVLLRKKSSVVGVNVCDVVIEAAADHAEKQAAGGINMALNMVGLLAAVSGTLAYLQEKKRREQVLKDTWQRLIVTKDPKFKGLLSAAVNFPTDTVTTEVLTPSQDDEKDE